ncbi:MAG: antibiotic biosynthesis monooxygenase [Cyclobacteriaceae bacterium]
MIVRIVRMTFQEDKIDEFLGVFEEVQDRIRNFEGCSHLELCRDSKEANILCTLSHWESETHLDSYRESALFLSTWAKTKVFFAASPIAFSLSKVEDF